MKSPSRFNPRNSKPEQKRPKQKETAPRQLKTFEDIKQQLSAWAENDRIPGKIQAWFTKDASPENADWSIVHKLVNGTETLRIEAPAAEMEPPEVVSRVNEQLHKEHLRLFRKAVRSIWFRATGDGRFALLMQVNLRGKNSAHAYKTFIDFLEKSCPEIISCHHIECTPNHLFDPSAKISMRVDTRCNFGSDFYPLANTGLYAHVLDWTPRIKDAWLDLPARIKEAIHPAPGDKFFDFYSSSSYVGASLANCFKQVESLDCRESAMLSSKFNSRNLPEGNLRFHRGHLEESTLTKFFNKAENDGRWTFYFNLPAEETLPAGIEPVIAASRPERILLQIGNLEIASKEIRRFRNDGYILRKSVPLYLEPGTGKFEVLFIFVPDRAGLLGLTPAQKARSSRIQRPQERVLPTKQGNTPHFVQKAPTFRQRKG